VTAEPHDSDPPGLPGALEELGKISPEFRAAVERFLADAPADSGRRLRLVGRARKVSVSMPEDLTAAVQRRVGRGEFSQYVTEAVARQLELDLVDELASLLEAEHGPVQEEALAEARMSWPDAQ
jgi:Arc/MetJ-type ribon-helix-helix transcriptional regulator